MKSFISFILAIWCFAHIVVGLTFFAMFTSSNDISFFYWGFLIVLGAFIPISLAILNDWEHIKEIIEKSKERENE